MSLTIRLLSEEKTIDCECSCGNKHKKTVCEVLFEYNITHNLTHMAKVAGIYEALWRPEEIYATDAWHITDKLNAGLEYLITHKKICERFNPENGWGKYEHFVEFVEKYLNACKSFPNAKIEVSR